jgi:hypothetical protein
MEVVDLIDFGFPEGKGEGAWTAIPLLNDEFWLNPGLISAALSSGDEISTPAPASAIPD